MTDEQLQERHNYYEHNDPDSFAAMLVRLLIEERAQTKRLQASIKEHNKHHLELAKERDMWRDAYSESNVDALELMNEITILENKIRDLETE